MGDLALGGAVNAEVSDGFLPSANAGLTSVNEENLRPAKAFSLGSVKPNFKEADL